MKRVLLAMLVLALVAPAMAFSAEEAKAPKKAAAVKQPKVSEVRLSEHDLNKIENAVSRAVIAKQGPAGWEYMAKKMKPPKNDKWMERWNEVGRDGWEAIDHFENVYIFKRPAMAGMNTYSKPVEPAKSEPTFAPVVEPANLSSEPVSTKSAKQIEKDEKAAAKKAEKEAKDAAKNADKEAKKAAKDAEKAAKQAEKDAKKAEKEAKKAAKEAAKKAE